MKRKSRAKVIEEGEEYIQTWLPYPSLSLSAEALSADHLNTQRWHNWQLISLLCVYILDESESSYNLTNCVWKHHPLVLQWKSHLSLLMQYQRNVCRRDAGKSGILEQCETLFEDVVSRELCESEVSIVPAWLGQYAYHHSHQSNLIRKDSVHYRPQFSDATEGLPYVWPK